jgi:hypothetical protein
MTHQNGDQAARTLTVRDSDVYVSLTTYGARIGLIQPVIRSVLNQWPRDRVLLTVADTVEVPTTIRETGIHIVRSADYGAFKKHSPCYLCLGINRYIVIDDDCIIPAGWLENLVRWSERLPGHVVCGAGRVWPAGSPMEWASGRRIHGYTVSSPVRTDIYIGSGTALFEPKLFEESVFPFEDQGFGEPGHTNWIGGDDIWFSAKLKSTSGIYVVPFSEGNDQLCHPTELDYARNADCVWLSEKARGFIAWNRALGHFAQLFSEKALRLTGGR